MTDEQVKIEKAVENYRREAEELRRLLQKALAEEKNATERMTPDEKVQVSTRLSLPSLILFDNLVSCGLCIDFPGCGKRIR